MNIEQIENFLSGHAKENPPYVKVTFKKREPLYGLFVQDKDYDHLKSKNFWRIVTKLHVDGFRRSADLGLAKIFNGADFSRLTASAEMTE